MATLDAYGHSYQFYARKILEEMNDLLKEVYPKALEKAKLWMQQHPSAFFVPPKLKSEIK